MNARTISGKWYQFLHSDRFILHSDVLLLDVRDFGLRWYLNNRLSDVLRRNWVPIIFRFSCKCALIEFSQKVQYYRNESDAEFLAIKVEPKADEKNKKKKDKKEKTKTKSKSKAHHLAYF